MQKIKLFKIIISKFTSKYIQLIFTFEKNKLLLQNFNYTFYKYEKSFFLILYIICHTFSYFILSLFSLFSLFFLLKFLNSLLLVFFQY